MQTEIEMGKQRAKWKAIRMVIHSPKGTLKEKQMVILMARLKATLRIPTKDSPMDFPKEKLMGFPRDWQTAKRMQMVIEMDFRMD